MKTDNRHFKCINSHTGNAIYYHAIDGSQNEKQVKAELDKLIAKVAIQNAMPVNSIYWQEIKNEN